MVKMKHLRRGSMSLKLSAVSQESLFRGSRRFLISQNDLCGIKLSQDGLLRPQLAFKVNAQEVIEFEETFRIKITVVAFLTQI